MCKYCVAFASISHLSISLLVKKNWTLEKVLQEKGLKILHGH